MLPLRKQKSFHEFVSIDFTIRLVRRRPASAKLRFVRFRCLFRSFCLFVLFVLFVVSSRERRCTLALYSVVTVSN